MVEANDFNSFDGNTPLDLGSGKRLSLSPEGHRSSEIIGGMAPPVQQAVRPGGAGPLAADLVPGSTSSAPVKAGGAGLTPAADLMPIKQSSGSQQNKSKDAVKASGDAGGGSQESDSFYKMYNKEIKVNQDEIPIILAELTDAAFNFIQRENYEKALILLQKTEGVLEVVSLEGCTRDKYVSFITYNNMSMCFQKLGMLEECIFYLKQSIQLVSDPKFFKSRKISARNKRVSHECKLKLQLCAILSQNQNHSEALENARKSVRLSHQMFRDMEELCQIYIDKINYRDNLLAAQEQSDLEDAERVQLISMVLESSPAKEIPKNFLEQSISLNERSSLKIHPVVREVRRRLVNSEIPPNQPSRKPSGEGERERRESIGENSSEKGPAEEDEDLEEEKPDMRSVLGFLNQNEWIYSLNIGNIMQIQPIAMKEFLLESNDETELSRDSFLSKLSVLIVTYFCMSTEMRFLLQSRAQYLKPEVKKERELESEFWHAKALEIACTFLPSECPLLNHVLLSYQKHHDPSMQPIKEDEESQDILSVLRPLKGIEQSKYQPIVRALPQVKVAMSPGADHVPLKQLLRDFDEQLTDEVISFNASRVRKIAPTSHKQVQAAQATPIERTVEQISASPTQANLSAIVLPKASRGEGYAMGNEVSELIGVVDNSNILPLSLNESQNEALASQPLSGHSQQTSTQKLKQEMYMQEQSILDDRGPVFDNNRSGIEGLEQQLLAAVSDSPREQMHRHEGVGAADKGVEGQGFPFDSRDDSFGILEMATGDDEQEAKLYDYIISKVLSNPRIDKKTLLKKFVAKIEMESNNIHGGLANELSSIKSLIQKEEQPSQEIQDPLDVRSGLPKNHAASQEDHVAVGDHMFDEQVLHVGAHSMQQILTTDDPTGIVDEPEGDSEVMLQVPSETADDQGPQNARPSRDTRRQRQQQKPNQSLVKEPVKNRGVMNTSTRTRSSSHNIKGSANKHSKRAPSNARVSEQKDFRKVKSYLEDESLFRDIEKSSEYQDLNAMEQSLHTDSAPVNVDDIQLEQKSSQKSRSGSNSQKRGVARHHSSVQSSDHQAIRIKNGQVQECEREGAGGSHKKSFTFSRPSTAVTNGTRHSSVNLRRGRRRQNMHQNQGAANPQKTLVAKELEDPMMGLSRSESSSRGRYSRYQARHAQTRPSEPGQAVNMSMHAKGSHVSGTQQSQSRLKHSQARKRLSVNHHHGHHTSNPAHGQSVEHPPAQGEGRTITKASQKRLPTNRHHNLSVQAQGPSQPPHHMTSKIKKLVSHKQIDTQVARRSGKYSKSKLSQTKNVLHPNQSQNRVTNASALSRGRARTKKQCSKSKSKSRSSGHRTYSGSSKRIKSRSKPRSGSEQRAIMPQDLAQYSLDLIDGDQVNINAASAHHLIPQQSKNHLQQQVLENQKTILGLLSQQRTLSNDSRSQGRKKTSMAGNAPEGPPIRAHAKSQSKIQRLSHAGHSNQISVKAQEMLRQAQAAHEHHPASSQTQILRSSSQERAAMVERPRSKLSKAAGAGSGIQNSSSQLVSGLSNFARQVGPHKQLDAHANKSLNVLKRQQKSAGSKGPGQPPKPKLTSNG